MMYLGEKKPHQGAGALCQSNAPVSSCAARARAVACTRQKGPRADHAYVSMHVHTRRIESDISVRRVVYVCVWLHVW